MNLRWQERQVEMEEWYRRLLQGGSDHAEHALVHEYLPYAAKLAQLRGRVLDIGGGAGLAGRFLDPACEYWVIDPAAIWADPEWDKFARGFRQVGAAPQFVSGTGEALPFEDASYDAALAFWSLNHASDVEKCVSEAARVLRPGGMALLVLEDMEPSWPDILRLGVQQVRTRLNIRPEFLTQWDQQSRKGVVRSAKFKLSGQEWPLQRDHMRILENDLRTWIRPGFDLIDRRWHGGFLSYQLRRRGNLSTPPDNKSPA